MKKTVSLWERLDVRVKDEKADAKFEEENKARQTKFNIVDKTEIERLDEQGKEQTKE